MLNGKTALVTGSTSGIGLAIAKAMASKGANVMLNGFGAAEEIEEIRAGIESDHGVEAAHHGADMSKPEEIRDLVAAAEARFGGVDILVNNAGIQHTASVAQFPEDKWDAIIAINLSALFHTTKAVLPLMQKTGWGRIINVSSVHGLVASVNKAAYVAAKHGVMGLTKVTALEWAGSGITCNAINPGWVRTPLVEKQIEARAEEAGCDLDEAARQLLAEKQPSQQFVTPEQLGELCLWLCSPGADQVTGQAHAMDGGWTAQ